MATLARNERMYPVSTETWIYSNTVRLLDLVDIRFDTTMVQIEHRPHRLGRHYRRATSNAS